MKEVEIKAKIKDFNSVISKLKEIGCDKISEPIIQRDIIFLGDGLEFLDIKSGTNVLRIRAENGKNILTLKQPQENELDCIEREVIIDNPREMEGILKCLGYHEVVRINKRRRRCDFKKYKICLDEVDMLGKFIEIEKMSREKDSIKVQDELFQLLLDLGIQKEERITKGYDTLIYRKINQSNCRESLMSLL
ncbi:MAG: class IV adenylate cyclase [Candidatus Omnitrophica bacterium]|nr:class IV adenylate cyclase [Candidatus Omnitrophota bacterium]